MSQKSAGIHTYSDFLCSHILWLQEGLPDLQKEILFRDPVVSLCSIGPCKGHADAQLPPSFEGEQYLCACDINQSCVLMAFL